MKLILSFGLLVATLLVFSFTAANKPNAKLALKTIKNFCVFIPSGNTVLDGDTTSVQSFFMSATEITNFQYNEFLWHLKVNGETEKLKIAIIDTAKWNTTFKNGYMEPMAEHYHDHPAYKDYPVVNVTKAGAELYCEWLTHVYDSLSGGEMKLKFRIPMRSEFLRAARGDKHQQTYAWEGPSLRNDKGLILANFLTVGAKNITRNNENGNLEIVFPVFNDNSYYMDGADLTAIAKSYWPNDFGVYNMNGNVSEMISDGDVAVGGGWNSPGYDIRNESMVEFKEAQPTVGFRVVATYVGEHK